VGLQFCEEALSQGHQLILLVRNPPKLTDSLHSNAKVLIIEGELSDKKAIEKPTSSGASVFVSFAGPVAASKGTVAPPNLTQNHSITAKQPITNAMRLIVLLLVANKFKRALILWTCSFAAPEDKVALKWKASVVLVKIIGGSAFEEFNGLGAVVTSQDVVTLKWTLFRVPFLGNGSAAPVTATYTGSGKDGVFLTRKSIVAWVLQEMGQNSEWIGKAPVLSN
jgi:hypothetical protein